MRRSRSQAIVERVARTMAERSGVRWDRLDCHSGCQRDRWRDEARGLLKQVGRRSLMRQH